MHWLEAIQVAFVTGQLDFTEHTAERAVERNIRQSEIREARRQAVAPEYYPDDKYGPTRLLVGFNEARSVLDIQVADSPSPRSG